MNKIEKLTKEQENRLAEFRKEWLNIGLCCDPADFIEAEKQITFFYEKLGKKKPLFFRFSSPIMCEFGLAALKILLKDESKLGSELWSKLWSKLESQLGSELGSQFGSQFGSELWSKLESQLGSQLESQFGSQLGSELWSQLWSQFGSELWPQLRSQLWSQGSFCQNSFAGQQSAYWQAFYLFCQEIGVKYDNNDIQLLNAWAAISRSVCWWAPWEGICIISDRPRHVSFDINGRLHNETKKSVEFSDGWGVYSWHGVGVLEEWITHKELLTPEIALKWENLEQRRAACEMLGWINILNKLNAKVIDKDKDPQIGILLEVDLPDSGKERFLKVTCGTGREFALAMPKHVKTALEGNAWTYGVDADSYKIEVRT